MADYHELRKKYPKWAHRRDHHAKKRRQSRSRRRRRSRRRAQAHKTPDLTNVLLVQLLHQIMGAKPLARKHGENVVTGYTGAVRPDRLAPVRSRDEYMYPAPAGPGGAAVGAAAQAGGRYPFVARAPQRGQHAAPR